MCSFKLHDGRKTRLKHVARLTEINKLRNVASSWLYSANILAIHRSMNVKVSWNEVHEITQLPMAVLTKIHGS